MFLSIPFIKGDNCDNEHTKGEKLRPCNHCDHPLAFVWGCQKFTPERGNRLPWHGSAINRISHISSIVNASSGICRCGGSWAACAARFQKGIFQFPGLPGLTLPLASPGACVAVCGFSHLRKAPVLSWPPIGAKAPRENKIWGGEPTRLCPFYFPHHLYNKVRYQNLALDFLFLSFIIERVFDYLGGAYE